MLAFRWICCIYSNRHTTTKIYRVCFSDIFSLWYSSVDIPLVIVIHSYSIVRLGATGPRDSGGNCDQEWNWLLDKSVCYLIKLWQCLWPISYLWSDRHETNIVGLYTLRDEWFGGKMMFWVFFLNFLCTKMDQLNANVPHNNSHTTGRD